MLHLKVSYLILAVEGKKFIIKKIKNKKRKEISLAPRKGSLAPHKGSYLHLKVLRVILGPQNILQLVVTTLT